MINFSQAKINKFIVHHVGSSFGNEGIQYAYKFSNVKEEEDIFSHILFSSFVKEKQLYRINGERNDDFLILKDSYYRNIEINDSHDIASQFYQKLTENPGINSGFLVIADISDIIITGEVVKGFAIAFVNSASYGVKLDVEKITDVNSFTEFPTACLFLSTEEKLCVVQNSGKNKRLKTSFFEFLNILEYEDSYKYTKDRLDNILKFNNEVYNEGNAIDALSQADLKAKIAKYFSSNDDFIQEDFENEVLESQDIIEAYQDFVEKNNVNTKLSNEFEISEDAFKAKKKYFKSILKLDKNFHVYIHGNRDNIERGYDEKKGLHFYKLYFNHEE